ncbi:ABC transporter ATP-binding protein [Arthrobacter sp. NPDC093139]|uniref:ABC transporter ATP-binding protein n=1 Tax=Arthrobacter sp. NPDC093139 TaxID=3363945 RepID=UPI0037FEB2CE
MRGAHAAARPGGGFLAAATRLIGLLAPVRGRMVIAIAATCGFAALNITAPKLLGDATDVVVEAFVGGDFDEGRLAELLVVVALMYVGTSLFNWLQGVLTATAVQRLIFELRAAVEDKLHRLPSSHFQEQTRGDVLSRATNDVDNISQSLNQLLTQVIMAVLMLCGSLAMMLWISPLLAAIALVSVPISTLITVLIARKSQAHFAEQWASTGALNAHIEEFVTGHEVIKAFGQQEAVSQIFASGNDRLARTSASAQYMSAAVQPLMVFIANLNYVAVAVVGALQVAAGAMTIGGVQAFIQFSRLFTQPMGQIGGMLTLMQSCAASAERVFSLLDSEEIKERPAAAGKQSLSGPIEFEDVTFGYVPGAPAVSGLTFSVQPGQTVAIVGHTGAGKTTVVNLLMRFYELDSGRITFGGTDIADVPLDSLRSHFGVVPQDVWLFSGTIRDNIEYGRPGASDTDITAAAEATHVAPFLRALPAGYSTELGNDGDSLSQGQRQLITIARAELAGRSVLILDEATSSVDTRTEVQIRLAMKRLRSGRTSFVIAHRLSTIRDADLILVMDHGRIVEQGTHRSLLSGDGYYTRLYNAQFRGLDRAAGERAL